MSSENPHQWTSDQVAAYLRSVNLAEKYAKVFEEEEVNGLCFTALTKEELKEEPFNMTGFGPIKTVTAAIEHMNELRRKFVESEAVTAEHTPAAQPPQVSPQAEPTPAPRAVSPGLHMAQHPEYPDYHGQTPPMPPLQAHMGNSHLPLSDPFMSLGMMNSGHMHPPMPQINALPMMSAPLPLPPQSEPWHGFGAQFPVPVGYSMRDVPVGLTFPQCPPPPAFVNFSSDVVWGINSSDVQIRPAEEEYRPAHAWNNDTSQQQHGKAVNVMHHDTSPGSGGSSEAQSPPRLLEYVAETEQPQQQQGRGSGGGGGGGDGIGNELQLALGRSEVRRIEGIPGGAGADFQRPKPIAEFTFSRADEIDRKGAALFVEPVGGTEAKLKFTRVQDNTDLTIPPANWLENDERAPPSHNPGRVIQANREFLTTSLGMSVPDVDSIDFIAKTENLKKLYTAPYTNKDMSLSVHKVGNTLILEDVNTENMQDDLMMSKLLYYSILAEDEAEDKKKKAAAEAPEESTATEPKAPRPPTSPIAQIDTPETPPPASLPKPDVDAIGPFSAHAQQVVDTMPAPESFQRSLKFHFQDLNLLLGSDQLVMKHEDGDEIALKLRSVDQPLSPSDALEYWLDNVMNNVPQVAICYHKDGVTQGYQLINTGEIPTISKEARFEPQIVQEYAGNVLHWLKENCTRDAGSYVLVRENGKTLKLYDLSSIYDDLEHDKQSETHRKVTTKQSDSTALVLSGGGRTQDKNRDAPFAYPVAMLCFRMGSKLADSGSVPQAQKAIALIQKALAILPSDTYPEIRAQAHAKLATAFINAKKQQEGTPTTPSSKAFVKMHDEAVGYQLAADELCKALFALENIPDHILLVELRERLIHCYLELAVRASLKDAVYDCLDWIAKAEHVILMATPAPQANSASLPLLMAPPGSVLNEGVALENIKPPTPPGGERAPPAFLTRARARLVETVGDFHQCLSRLQLSDKEDPTADLPRLLGELLASAGPESVLNRMKPISEIVDENINKAMEYYYSAMKHVALIEAAGGAKSSSPFSEIKYSSQVDLRMKLGRMFNLWATVLIRENRLHNASDQYRRAYECFSDPQSEVSRATTAMNLGRVLMRLAANDAGDSPKTLSETEENFTNKALSYYHDAVTILSQKKYQTTQQGLLKDAQISSANSQMHLAKRIKHHFVTLEDAPGVDYEKRCADLLVSAIAAYTAVGDDKLIAETNAHIGQLYYISLRRNYNPESKGKPGGKAETQAQRQERRFKMSEVHSSRAADYYSQGKDDAMFLMLRREITRLHLFQLSSNSLTPQYLKTVARALLKVAPWLKNVNQDVPGLKEELNLQLSLIKDVLAEALKVHSQPGAVVSKRRKLSKEQEARLNPSAELADLAKQADKEVPAAQLKSTVLGLLDSLSKLLLRE